MPLLRRERGFGHPARPDRLASFSSRRRATVVGDELRRTFHDAYSPRADLCRDHGSVYSIVLALFGLLIFQNLFGIWPEDSPADTVEVSLRNAGSLPDEQVSDLETRLTGAVLDTLQTRREAAGERPGA